MINIHKKDFLLSKRDHRVKNYWDVNYDPNFDIESIESMTIRDINEKNIKEIINKNIYIGYDEIIKNDIRPDVNMFINNKSFRTCDFSGNNGKKKITISNCNFEKCYFSFSEFNDVNFINCDFECCSFSQARFYRCFFDDNCSFYNISISGSTTLMVQTEIRASGFFKKIYEPYNEQSGLYKEKGLNNKENIFRIKCFIKIIYLYFFKKPAFAIESIVMRVFGFINGWGSSLPRVFIFGVFILLMYTIIYMIMDGGQVPIINDSGEAKNIDVTSFYYFVSSLLKSFDVTFLAGYTKHITMYDSIFKQLTLLTNMLVGLFWYSVLIPTLINKISVNKI